MFSQTIAAADPTPFNKPRFIRWPSVCDTSRTNWLGPDDRKPATPSPALQNHVEFACMFDPRAPEPIDPQVLAACSSIDCSAPPSDPSLTFTAHAAQRWNPTLDIGTRTLDVGLGIPLPITRQPPSKQKRRKKKMGRPTTFDEVARARFCGMIETGCTIRYAAKRLGITRRTVRYACRTDPAFADRLRRAEQDRDLAAVSRIHNAGEKSWRAAAWLLERVAPQEFSFRRGPTSRTSPGRLGKRQFKQLVAEVAKQLPLGQKPDAARKTELPQPNPRLLTTDVIEAKIVELLEPLPPDERFNLMYRLGY